MKYRSEIDGLRAVAVIPVILFHAGFQWFSGGFVGVDVFFVISGYLITSIIIAELDAKRFSIANFYERRARRILPALFFVLACCLPFAWFLMLPSGIKAFSESLIAVSVFSSNILFWSESGYFDVSTHYKPLLHTWSLAVEEQYYIFFPLFLMSFWKLGKSKLFWVLTTSLIICLWIGCWGVTNKPNAGFYLLPFRAWELLIGACAGFYLYTKPKHLQKAPNMLHQILSILGILMILHSVFTYDQDANTFKLYALSSTVGATLIILYASSNTLAAKVLSLKPMVGIGLISYSAYLWHQPIFSFARHASIAEPSVNAFLALSVLVLPLSWFSWRYIEGPFRNKSAFNQKEIFKLSLIGTFIVISIGLVGTLTQGFLSRYNAEDQHLASLNPNSMGDYVKKRFNDLSMRPFDLSSDKTKVLVIGDSYAEDLINAMYEAGLNKEFQFSTRHIGKQCGNLFIKFDVLKPNIKPSDLDYCEKRALYNDKELTQLIKSADEVWFSSAWGYWQAELLPKSIRNLELFSKRIRVFSSKNMGEINVKHFLSISPKERAEIKNKPSEDSVKTNALLRAKVSPEQFVDIEKIICDGEGLTCPVFTENGELITHDGGHLTQAGAKFLGFSLNETTFKFGKPN